MDQQYVVELTKKMLSEQSDSSLLSLPQSLLSLRHLCLDPNTNIDDIEQSIAQDAAFSAYIIQLANSSLYGLGKIPCENLSCAIRRLGIYSVSQFALSFALKKRHDLDNVSVKLTALLKDNWLSSWSLVQGATEIYWRHRQSGANNAKRVDVSDVLILGVLVNTGRLAVITACCNIVEKMDDELDIGHVADKLNLQLLPILFQLWGLPQGQAKLYSQPLQSGHDIHAIDYLLAEALLNAYGKGKERNSTPKYNFIVHALKKPQLTLLSERLESFQLLLKDQLDFEFLEN